MKGVGLFYILGLFLLIISCNLVLGFDSGSVSFGAANSPLYNVPSNSDPAWTCVDDAAHWVCAWTDSNGIFPVKISDNTKFVAGENLKIINPSGQVCDRVQYAGCWCKTCCCRNCAGSCNEGTLYDYTTPKVKIGFYSSNVALSSNLPIAEYPLSSFVGSGIPIPAGTNYIYVYFVDTAINNYWDNNQAYKINLNYEVGLLCTPGNCNSYPFPQCGSFVDGCGTTINCNMGIAQASCSNGTLVCNSGFANCDGSWANGCEYNTANFLTDENNCGACGNVCDSGKLCIDGTCGGDNYWADLNGNLITNADLNDYVKVVSYDSPPFDITEDLDPIITINSNAWKANRSTTLGYNVTSDNYGVNATSLLYVSTTDQDDPMIIEVLNPSCGSYYNKGQTIQVRINASDADDIIYGTVKIEGVNIKNFTNSNSNIINFSYTFSTAGNIQILVEATNTRGKKFKTISNVMVVDNSPSGDEIQYYVASCIDEPKNYEVFNKALIYFNASSTQGLKYTKSTNNYTIISPLLLLFNWTFYSGQTQKYLTPCSGLGSESCPYDSSGTVIHFYRTFPTINDNYAFLSVSIPNNLMV